jgi:D-alanyl-D-alanine carboxypeptidase
MERIPQDDLQTLITLEYGISREYRPQDLISLNGLLPITVTLGYPTEIRAIILGPLTQMIDDMLSAGLRPTIISGYRSYSTQAIAWQKWQETEPDRAAIISAPPGHSEHQLGTTIDFGSPELVEIVGQDDIEFHTDFYKTSEGAWLEQHAYEYGFTLTLTLEAWQLTGLYYEPWHYRYVGKELAQNLHERNMSLIEYLLELRPLPCIR